MDKSVYSVLKVDDAFNARSSFGGTAKNEVEARLEEAAVRFNLNNEIK